MGDESDDALDDVVQSIDSPGKLERAVHGTLIRSVEFHQSLPSTNDRGLELAKSPGSDDEQSELPALILAVDQTAGRGRKGDCWLSPAGNLALSLIHI